MTFGAKADGKADINQPLMAAWKEACALVPPSKTVIPEGEYMLSQGASATQLAAKLACSSGIPGENVVINGDIDLSYNGTEGTATSESCNVKPTRLLLLAKKFHQLVVSLLKP
ncbi:hypothetical protein REPUB_Repub13aG0054400 [Reevesia pubescens]